MDSRLEQDLARIGDAPLRERAAAFRELHDSLLQRLEPAAGPSA